MKPLSVVNEPALAIDQSGCADHWWMKAISSGVTWPPRQLIVETIPGNERWCELGGWPVHNTVLHVAPRLQINPTHRPLSQIYPPDERRGGFTFKIYVWVGGLLRHDPHLKGELTPSLSQGLFVASVWLERFVIIERTHYAEIIYLVAQRIHKLAD